VQSYRYDDELNLSYTHLVPTRGREEANSACTTGIVVFPGGGFVAVRRHLVDPYLQFLAKSQQDVFIVDYPLMPESDPFPETMIVAVLRALTQIRKQHGIKHITLMGDSAGGALAIMISSILGHSLNRQLPIYHSVNFEALPQLSAMILCYPFVGLPESTSFQRWFGQVLIDAYGGKTPLMDRETLEHIWTPTRTMLICGTADPLYPFNLEFAQRFPGEIRTRFFDKQPHGFLYMLWIGGARKQAQECILGFIV